MNLLNSPFHILLLSISLILLMPSASYQLPRSHSSSSSNRNSNPMQYNSSYPEYFLSEVEYRILEMNDYLLDYAFNEYTTTCPLRDVLITAHRNPQFYQYSEPSLTTSIKSMAIFASDSLLKVNVIALLANSTLITFVDDASSSNQDDDDDETYEQNQANPTRTQQQYKFENDRNTTHLQFLKAFPIPNDQDICYSLLKISSTAFTIECSKAPDTPPQESPQLKPNTITLFLYETQTNFSSSEGIDLSTISPTQTELTFDPLPYISQNLSENTFIEAYNNCQKESSFYTNATSSTTHYFRLCKFHETKMANIGSDQNEEKAAAVSSFFEMYDLSSKTQTVIAGFAPSTSDATSKFQAQGVQQYNDASFVLLDFNDGLLFFYENPETENEFINIEFFIKYFYDQKYINLFVQKNVDPEFTIQDSIPDYLVLNTQSYLLYYAINTATSIPPYYFESQPSTLSIAHFIQSVKQIHEQNQQQQSSSSTNSNTQMPLDTTDNINNVDSFKAIKYYFDPYLYYIEIKYTALPTTYFLLINRALTDNTDTIDLNPQAIEMDYISNCPYARIFNYFIPGLFYSHIRSRVRLFQLGTSAKQFTYSPTQQQYTPIPETSLQQSKSLAITTYSWKSPDVLQLQTRSFNTISTCFVTLSFLPKPGSGASGKKTIPILINLVPRNFTGIIPRYGFSMNLTFSNPKPIFQINNWFFGPSIDYAYSSGSSPEAQMNIVGSSVTNVTDATSFDPPVVQSEILVEQNTNCINFCSDKLVAAIQVNESYYIFYQTCMCGIFVEECTLTTTTMSPPTATNSTQTTCRKSNPLNITAAIDKLVFDGSSVVLTSLTPIPDSTGQYKAALHQLNLRNGTLSFIQDSSQEEQKEQQHFNVQPPAEHSTPSQIQFSLVPMKKFTRKSFSKTPTEILNHAEIPSKQVVPAAQPAQIKDDPSSSQGQFNIESTLLDEVQQIQIYCIPNTSKCSMLVQSNPLKLKFLSIFEISGGIKDYSEYTYTEAIPTQNTFDVSLLDRGILISTQNENILAGIKGCISVSKVNFLTKTITLNKIFTKADMLNQIREFQLIAIDNNNNSNNSNDSSEQMPVTIVDNIDQFMNDFTVQIWRNDDNQTYRLLLIDFENNCIFDYYLYDLIKPVFVRQVNLYDFSIFPNQNFEITNNMIGIHASKGEQEFIISLAINEESIVQIKKIQPIQDNLTYSQVQQSISTPYQSGTLCGIFTDPNEEIECIFNPYIKLQFDYTGTSNSTLLNSNTTATEDSSSDKTVLFSISLTSDLNNTESIINLQTSFTNFDTNLLNTTSANQTTTYFVNSTSSNSQTQGPNVSNNNYRNNKNSSNASINDWKQNTTALPLIHNFVSGSIESYFIDESSEFGIEVQGYISMQGFKQQTLDLQNQTITDYTKNPYQLVGLTDKGIIVINQNLKFKFELIDQINYADIPFASFVELFPTIEPPVIQSCDSIFSNEVQTSQTTDTYIYVIRCIVSTKNVTGTNYIQSQQFVSFFVDVNSFSSLENQRSDWKKALQKNVKLIEVAFVEEDLDSMIQDIQNIQILSLADSNNDLAGFIFLVVRQLQAGTSTQLNDNTIYVLWGKFPTDENLSFFLNEIDQINSSDLELNFISVNNFAASFPWNLTSQNKMNFAKQQDFIFNIGWDDSERYVFLALLKLTLPPFEGSSGNSKQVFSTQYSDIYSQPFQSFIKSEQTWDSPFTQLKSTITFYDNSYNANVFLTNQFSIIEYSVNFSPNPYLIEASTSRFNPRQSSALLDPSDDFTSQRRQLQTAETPSSLNSIVIYKQFAWCENEFNQNQVKEQQMLKFQDYFLIQCMNTQTSSTSTKPKYILKVYKIQDSDYLNESFSLATTGTQSQVVQNSTYSMVQSLDYGSDKLIKAMSFRLDNLELYLDLTLESMNGTNKIYELYQYSVNGSPILIVPSNITDQSTASICVRNKYTSSLCGQAVFSNKIINEHDISVREWIIFAFLIIVPTVVTFIFIFAAFVSMKNLRKKRQDEFVDLLQGKLSEQNSASQFSLVDNLQQPLLNQETNHIQNSDEFEVREQEEEEEQKDQNEEERQKKEINLSPEPTNFPIE